MTTPEDAQQAIADALEHINGTIRTISGELRAIRRRSLVLGLSVALDILLSVGLALALSQTNSTAALARSEVVARCQNANQLRTAEKNLWAFIIADSRKTATTPQQVQTINAFQAEVNKTFVASNCRNIGT